jgi:hypothetical protein
MKSLHDLPVRIFLSLFFFIASVLFARDVEVTVEDADLQIPLEGAVILLRNGEEYTCDEDGKAFIALPDNEPAVIRIAYPGYENRRLTIPAAEAGVQRITVALRLGGIMENQELVLEVERPGTSETRSGRSVAISAEALTRTAEIGIIEDVMNSIKLLPGVGYTGFFNAMPSIRGGFPGDLTAVLDGFYVENPYHWGGGFSIFDPKMIESARLSHGIFSARYGHTISGLLELSSRKPSSTEVELDAGVSTSAANLNLSYPLGGKGGIMAMGRVTYYDPFVWAVKQVAKYVDILEPVNAVKTAPYIRSGALSGQYRFTADLELTANAFFGADGAGAEYTTEYDQGGFNGNVDMLFDWINYQGFFTGGLVFNPRPNMVLKTSVGAGFLRSDIKGDIYNNLLSIPYSQDFIDFMNTTLPGGFTDTSYSVENRLQIEADRTVRNLQGRADFDWDLGRGFLLALGVQELYTQWIQAQALYGRTESAAGLLGGKILYNNYPIEMTFPEVKNQGFNSSAYSLLEYTSPGRRFGTELGLRMDHLYFLGKDFSVQSMPVLNPRLNLDYVILKDRGIVDTLSATAGTGLFSSMNDAISLVNSQDGIDDFEMKQNRSWTSVVGTKIDFIGGFSFNIEGYYKYVFDRAYVSTLIDLTGTRTDYWFDGEGRIWGFDLMLQKLESRYIDGWLSYSFNYARYHDPHSNADTGESDWYFPSFHRFHNLNLILNIKPIRRFNIALRFGFASGAPKSVVVGDIEWYPVAVLGEDKNPTGEYFQNYKRQTQYSDTGRDGFSLPLDLKFSWYFFDKKGKVQSELYLGIENILFFVKSRRTNTSFNSYTGQEDEGSDTAAYDLPIPMISFGIKWSY